MGLDYDGVDDSISIASYTAAQVSGTTIFTVSFWIKVENLAGGNYTLVIMDTAGSQNFGFRPRINTDGTITICTTRSCVGSTAVTSTDTISEGVWSHVVLIVNSGVKIIINNGTPRTGTQRDGGNPAQAWYVGSTGGGSAFFEGIFAELGMWIGVELTANEITALFRGAKPSTIRPSSLKMYLPMHLKDGSGDTPNLAPIDTKNKGVVVGAVNSDHAPVRNNESYYGQGSN